MAANKLFVPVSAKPVSFVGHVLVVPAMSVGSVPQLCCDLLLASLKAVRVGFIDDDAIIPWVCRDALLCGPTANLLTLPAEVYTIPETKVAILQLRSSILQSKAKDRFVARLVAWAIEQKFSNILFLTSYPSSLRRDELMNKADPLWFSSVKNDADVAVLQKLGWKELTAVKIPEDALPYVSKNASATSGDEKKEDKKPTLPEPLLQAVKHFAKNTLAKEFCEASLELKFPVLGLGVFASDGNNAPDGIEFATTVLRFLGQSAAALSPDRVKLTPPPSWDFVFGTSMQEDM